MSKEKWKRVKIYCCFEAFMSSKKEVISDPKFFDNLKEIIECVLMGETPFQKVFVKQLFQKEVKE